MNPQQENLPSESGSKVENLLEEERLKKHDSEKEYYVDSEIKKKCKVEAEKVEAEKVEAEKVEAEKVDPEKVSSKSPSKSKGKVSNFYFVWSASISPADNDTISEKTKKGCKETNMKEEENLSNNDPRKFDLDNN